MSTGIKIAAGITKIFLGLYGVDFFIAGKIGKAVRELVSTIITIVLVAICSVVSFIPVVGMIAGILSLALSLSLVVRGIINLVKGIIILVVPASAAKKFY